MVRLRWLAAGWNVCNDLTDHREFLALHGDFDQYAVFRSENTWTEAFSVSSSAMSVPSGDPLALALQPFTDLNLGNALTNRRNYNINHRDTE